MTECKLGLVGADKIGEMLYHSGSIVSIDLSSNDIMDSRVVRLVHHVHADSALQHLNLKCNGITAVGVNHLSKSLTSAHPTLTGIELSQNHLNDKGVHVILSSLTVPMQ